MLENTNKRGKLKFTWRMTKQHQNIVPEAVPCGKIVEALGGATQGITYGRNRYKGPKPPFRTIHTYVFTVYILDCKYGLSPKSKKGDLLGQMKGHILQQAILSGKFQSNRKLECH